VKLTCLKCGHQFEVATGPAGERYDCICGSVFNAPGVIDTGVLPDHEAAERSRAKAFRAAGLVRNVGGFALGISALGVLFFPLALVGAAIGVYCLTMLRGPIGRYSGRRYAIWAIVIGACVFVLEGNLAMGWIKERRAYELYNIQKTGPLDLKRLRRSQVLFRATHERYGDFKDFRFKPATGRYTLYLGQSAVFPGRNGGKDETIPLPMGLQPGVSATDFTAVAVADLDGDPELDVWMMTAHGTPVHLQNDLANVLPPDFLAEVEKYEAEAQHDDAAPASEETPPESSSPVEPSSEEGDTTAPAEEEATPQ
jgi:hypothetical protein